MAIGVPRSVDELASMLGTGYTPKSQADIESQAQAELNPGLRSQVLGNKQVRDATVNSARAQTDRANAAYDQQYAAQKMANKQTMSSVERGALARGMGRSSYNVSRMANVALQGDKALNDIETNRANTINSIASQIQLAEQQMAEKNATATQNYQDTLLARIRALQDQEYTRGYQATSDTNALLQKLFSLAGSGYSGNSSQQPLNTGNVPNVPDASVPTTNATDDFLRRLSIG